MNTQVAEYHVMHRTDAVLVMSQSEHRPNSYSVICKDCGCNGNKPAFVPVNWWSAEAVSFIEQNNPLIIKIEDWDDYLEDPRKYLELHNLI